MASCLLYPSLAESERDVGNKNEGRGKACMSASAKLHTRDGSL